MGVLGYWLFGYAFAYGDNTTCDSEGVCTSVQNGFIGSLQFAMHDFPATSYHTWFFQYVFAISTATIVSGAVAERVTMLTYVLCKPLPPAGLSLEMESLSTSYMVPLVRQYRLLSPQYRAQLAKHV